MALVFTVDGFGEGLTAIVQTFRSENVKGTFFFTELFYRNSAFQQYILPLQENGHYLGPHSDSHLLYCDRSKRDSLLVSRDGFSLDLAKNTATMKVPSIPIHPSHFLFHPLNGGMIPLQHGASFRVFSFTRGMRTSADYTWPQMGPSYKAVNGLWIG